MMPAFQPPVVALVSSVGGLDALTRVLTRLPSTFPAPLLALQHADPRHDSRLGTVLASRCRVTVAEANQGDRLAAGHVLVAPSGQHTLVTAEQKIALIPSKQFPPYRPSADLLLVSLALSMGPRAVVTVLSGLGRDGATGATAVHHFGGTVIASDEASSLAYEMPAASIAREGTVDLVRDLDTIAELLEELVSGQR